MSGEVKPGRGWSGRKIYYECDATIYIENVQPLRYVQFYRLREIVDLF